jgi:ABC-type nitrate/sulfonate/bicarbonate transport system substrate-binding protein
LNRSTANAQCRLPEKAGEDQGGWFMISMRLPLCVGTVVVAAQLAGPAQAQQKLTYIVVNNLFSTPAYVAAENGYWAQQGLDVAVKLTGSGRAVTQAVQAGDAQFGHAALSTTIASARASGNMLKGVIAYYNAADYIAKAGGRAIIGRKDRGIDANNPKSMEGKKTCICASGSRSTSSTFRNRSW